MKFNRMTFEAWLAEICPGAFTLPMSSVPGPAWADRLQPGFVAVGVYPWLASLADDRQPGEVAIVSRTWLEPDEILATPDGVAAVVLDQAPWRSRDGERIAVHWIERGTEAGEELLGLLGGLPARWLACVSGDQAAVEIRHGFGGAWITWSQPRERAQPFDVALESAAAPTSSTPLH